jgi:hypothetical protein
VVADPGDDGAVGDAGDGNVEVTGQAVVLIARWEMGRESQPGLHGQGMNGLKALTPHDDTGSYSIF